MRSKFANGVPHGGEVPYFLNTVDIFEGTKDIFTDRGSRVRAPRQRLRVRVCAHGQACCQRQSGLGKPSRQAGQDAGPSARPITEQSNFMRARMNIFLGVSRIVDRVLGRR